MNPTKRTIIVAVAAAAAMAGIVGGVAVADRVTDSETPITGPAYDKATQAALAHTGGGEVTETEVGDEDSYYEVEVRLPDGRQVDVQLDKQFRVLDAMADDDTVEDNDDGTD